MPRFITKTIHSYLDYPVAAGLLVMPVLFGLGASSPMAFWLSVVAGIAALVLTLLTDHDTGVFPIFPYSLHLIVDALVGVGFIAAPFVLSFSGLDAAYYWVIGAAVMCVVGLHKPQASRMQTA